MEKNAPANANDDVGVDLDEDDDDNDDDNNGSGGGKPLYCRYSRVGMRRDGLNNDCCSQ